MSGQDLRDFLDKLDVDPPAATEPTSIEELIGPREDIEAISAQRDMEVRFNNPEVFSLDVLPDTMDSVFDPTEPPRVGEFDGLTAGETLRDLSFVAGYSSRLIRSILALSGTSASSDKFGDITRSEGFWAAYMDLAENIDQALRGKATISLQEIKKARAEQIKKIPGLLTDPAIPENVLPSVGNLIAQPFPVLEPVEWLFDVLGELIIEANIIKATKSLARKGMSKITKSTFDAGEEIIKKKGIGRLLGQLDDDELRAIDEAVRFRKVGKLGTKPAQNEIDDAVRRTFDYIDESKPSQLIKKEVISAKRKEAAAKMYDIQGDGYGPGYSARLRRAGTTTATERSFTPLLEVSDGTRLSGKNVFFHGTSKDDAANILKKGINVNQVDQILKRPSAGFFISRSTTKASNFGDEILQLQLKQNAKIATPQNLKGKFFVESAEEGILFNNIDVINAAKKQGFDVVDLEAFSNLTREPISELAILNPNVLESVGIFSKTKKIIGKGIDDYITLQKTIDNFDFGGSKIYTTVNTQNSLSKLYEYGELLTPGEVEGLRDIFGKTFADSLDKFVSKPTGLAGRIFEVGNKALRGLNQTSRTLMTTGELSFLLRQGNFRAWSRPKDAMRSWSVSMRSLISPKYADKIDDVLRFSRSGNVGTKHGLFLGRWRDVKRLTQREEVFMAEWLDKVPVIGQIKKSFERGYVSGLNQIRVDWFDEGLQIIERTGRGGDDKLISKWATYVNNMTGRADLDNIKDANAALKSMAETAKSVMFAPRFTVSKWNKHKVAAEIMFGKDTPNAMRRLLANDAAVKWRRYERLAHYFVQNGGEVETDPRSSDFLKLKVGDTRFDVLGGEAQLSVMLARLATGQTKDLATGQLKDNIATEIAQQYLAGKLNPLWSTIFDKFVAQQTFEGEDINDPKVFAKMIRDKFIPLYLNDIKDKIFNEYEEQGKTLSESIERSVPVAILGFGGAGIQTFEPSARKQYEIMIEDKAQELHGKGFDELPLYLKKEVVWEAENDDIDKTELLQEEMGMRRQSPGSAARLTKIKNKSFRAIRNGLGKDYTLFKESNIPVREFPIDIGDVRLSTEQHDKLSKLYVKFIKEELKQYPDISDLPPLDYERRRWLEDIESNAREDAIDELTFSE